MLLFNRTGGTAEAKHEGKQCLLEPRRKSVGQIIFRLEIKSTFMMFVLLGTETITAEQLGNALLETQCHQRGSRSTFVPMNNGAPST